MPTLTPKLTATPGTPVTYNPSMADTFSWVPVEGAERPLFARASFLTNASDISITTGDVNVDLTTVESGIALNNSLLTSLTASSAKVPGFSIPEHDEISLSYYGSTNNLQQVDYKKSSTTVLSLSFAYNPQPPTSNSALLATVKKL